MIRKSKKIYALFFTLLFAVTALFMSFAEPVKTQASKKNSAPDKRKYLLKSHASDNDDESVGVHADPATFEKNYVLSIDQKEYTITECEKVVAELNKKYPDMSDLEKYYRLAIWANKRVKYDWQFWHEGYHFDYYSHQWDAYGAMDENEKSVCVGIAIFYSNLCHAADLPCRFVRLLPEYLDHTIDYIPDINGNAYYVDVTENVFLHSEYSSDAFDNVDKNFAHITKDCTDTTFDYRESADSFLVSTDIKQCYNITYDQWFNEYALHNNTTKIFPTEYVEKGSGDGTRHVSYHDIRSNFTDQPDVWFLDDFYKNPAATKAKILNKEFDQQLLNVSGVKKNYECNTIDELEAAIGQEISVKYFPSSENGQVVAKSVGLIKGVDYKVVYNNYDAATKTAQFTIEGTGAYTGSYPISVKMKSAVVVKAPVPKKGLVYNGSSQELVEPGQAESGEMQYALGTKTEATGSYSTDIPSAKNAGKYYIWYKAVGDGIHGVTEPQRIERAISIAPIPLTITVKNITIEVGGTANISPTLNEIIPVTYVFDNMDTDIVSVDENGKVTGLKEGFAVVFISCNMKYSSSNYYAPKDKAVIIDVVSGKVNKAGNPKDLKGKKAANPMILKGKKVAVKYKSLKKKSKAIKRNKVIAIKNAKGKLSYKLVAAKKGKKSFKKMFRISKKTGKVVVKKGLKRGTYRVKVKVKAAGDAQYKASAWKSVVFKVKVK